MSGWATPISTISALVSTTPEKGTFCEGCGAGGSVNSVEVDVSRRAGNALGLLIAPIIGVKRHDLAASATVAQQKRALMLVQDFSCSMNQGSYPRPIDISRRASILFLDYMTDFNQAGDMLGLTGYAEYGVKGPGRGNSGIGASIGGGLFETLRAIINALFARASAGNETPFVELSDVRTEQVFLRQMFTSICSTQHGCPDETLTNTTVDTPYPPFDLIGSCTNPGVAIEQAVTELTTKADNGYFRGIVVMSDGAFNCGGGECRSPSRGRPSVERPWHPRLDRALQGFGLRREPDEEPHAGLRDVLEHPECRRSPRDLRGHRGEYPDCDRGLTLRQALRARRGTPVDSTRVAVHECEHTGGYQKDPTKTSGVWYEAVAALGMWWRNPLGGPMRRRPSPLSRRANYTMLMGFAILLVVGFAAIAVDISLIAMGEMQAQATADSAAHAAIIGLRNSPAADVSDREVDANAAATYMVSRNDVGLGKADLDAVRFGTYESAAGFSEGYGPGGSINSIKLDISRRGGNSMDLLIAPIIGVTNHDLAASSTVAQQKRAIMLVQDFSCSMNDGSYPEPIDISRRANVLFLDYMTDFNQAGDKLGLAGYAEFGVRGPPKGDPAIGASIGGGTYATVEELSDAVFDRATVGTDNPLVTLSNVANDQAYLRSMFSSVCNTQAGCPDEDLTATTTNKPYPRSSRIGTCTNPGIAMQQAIHQLLTNADDSYFRGIIVMSDGAFNCGGASVLTTAAANQAWNTHGIHIWTVLFKADDFNEDEMKNLIRGYGTFSNTPNVDDLPEIYAGIAASLPTAIVD